ncbi:MAG: lysozyme [Flavobacteriaceae bacterium]|jgi:lysozyme
MSLIDKSTDSLGFIICRSGQENTYTDPKFSANWKMIKEKGFIRGASHFYVSDDDPQTQATHFLGLISYLDDQDLSPVVDFE